MPYLAVCIVIILLLAIAPVIVYLYFSGKITNLQRQLMLLSRQNDELRNNLGKQSFSRDIVNITYVHPNFSQAITSEYCNLYLCPMENSPIVSKVDIGLQIEIHDSAKLSDGIWYEVSLPAITRVNNRGWIKESSIKKIL